MISNTETKMWNFLSNEDTDEFVQMVQLICTSVHTQSCAIFVHVLKRQDFS